MIELQVLNKVLETGSLTFLRQNDITADYFISYQEEYQFIMTHYQQYGNIPNKETFIQHFDQFDLMVVTESDKYLIETLAEQYIYSKMVPVVHKLADMVTNDAKGAVDWLRGEMATISQLAAQYKAGYDIVKNADDRKTEYERRVNLKGLLGITTGIPELDEITHGWMRGEELVTIVGRTNEGKTWVMLFFLVIAWQSGESVLLYSGEMGHLQTGFRFDTLNAKFSNKGLMQGKTELGAGGEPKDDKEYYEYLTNLGSKENPFIVVTPKDLGGKRLNIPVLHDLIEQYKPTIIGIDQLSLMDDYRATKGEQTRLRYTHIAEDLFTTSETYGVPILSPAQAKRGDKKDDENTPKTEDVAESDGIPQNSSRVIGIKHMGTTMKLGIPKNRYGPNNQELMLLWDIDKGVVKPFLQASVDKDGKATDTTSLVGGEELF